LTAAAVASSCRSVSAASLIGLFKGTLAKTEVGFEQMNAALKARVEQASARSSPTV
jgi:hypothetical protein